MYHYLGNERLQLWFASPNVCAAFLAMTIILAVGLFLYCLDRKRLRFRMLVLIPGGLLVVQFFLLAHTYSRGGYVALTVGLMFVWIICRRWWVMVWFMLFVVVLLSTPNGFCRIGSIGAIDDGSIRNRLFLWNGGSGIIADNWFRGVGTMDNAGKMCTAWHQPLWLDERYRGLISDYLNIAVSYGIIALYAYLALLFTVVSGGLRLWWREKEIIPLCILGALISYLSGSIFSTFCVHRSVYCFFLALLLTMVVCIFRRFSGDMFKNKWLWVAVPGGGALLICVALYLWGVVANHNIPYTYRYESFRENGVAVQFCEARPRTSPEAVIVYLFNSQRKSIESEARSMIRHLLAENYAVITAGVDTGLEGLAKAVLLLEKVALRRNEPPMFIMGREDGARQAIVAATRLNVSRYHGIISLGTPASWSFDELSPSVHIKNLKIPLLLIHGRDDAAYPYGDSMTLKRICDENNLFASIYIIPGSADYSLGKQHDILDAIGAFITENIGTRILTVRKTTEKLDSFVVEHLSITIAISM